MDELIQFLEELPAWQKAAWVLVCLSANLVFESLRPLFQLSYRKWRHARSNFALLVASFAFDSAFAAATVGVFAWTAQNRVGLLNWTSLPVWAELLLAIVFLDLIAQYVAHFLLHKLPWMWRFHTVHHTDVNVDATTAVRLHPGDLVFREFMALLAIVVVGVPFAFYIAYRLVTFFFSFVTHANISLPAWLDRAVSYVFVTPNLHKFHHHLALPWTDTNYGNVFSIWDRMFGTLVYDDVTKVRYGLDTVPDDEHENLLYQLKLPFNGAVGRRPSSAWSLGRGARTTREA